MEVATSALNGLGQQAQDLISLASSVDLKSKEEVKNSYKKLKRYLEIDNLRNDLNYAIGGLIGVKKALNKHANKFFQLPETKRDRTEAVKQLQVLINELSLQYSSL
jgi:hypothetical protein